MPPVDPSFWERPQIRAALARRDIGAVYRELIAEGYTRRQLGELAGHGPSTVSEILAGRPVAMYPTLERIAVRLGIPRGYLGLAYSEDSTYPDHTPSVGDEVDEAVKRRQFLAAAGAVAVGAPVLGEPQAWTLTDVIQGPPQRVGMSDVRAFAATVRQLGVLDREAGGSAARSGLLATTRAGEAMLNAQASDLVRRQLRYAVSEAHRLAGWAAGDIGLLDHCRWHMDRSLRLASDHRPRMAQTLCSTADMEKQAGDPNHALKLLQLAQIGADESHDPQAIAVLHGLSAGAYVALDRPDLAKEQIKRARGLFAQADPSRSLPFFEFYGPGCGLLAAVQVKLGDHEQARHDVTAALQTRPAFDRRCDALDTIVLATALLNGGEVDLGITATQDALRLVAEVASQRVRDRLEPLETALRARNDSTCTDLADQARAVRLHTTKG